MEQPFSLAAIGIFKLGQSSSSLLYRSYSHNCPKYVISCCVMLCGYSLIGTIETCIIKL